MADVNVDDEEENKKRANMRIYVESLYKLNETDPDNLIAALEACADENSSMTPFCNNLINAIKAKRNGREDDYNQQIQSLANETNLSPSHRKLADFLSENHPEVKFDVMVPALEEWTFDQGKDKTAILKRLKTYITNVENTGRTDLSAEVQAIHDAYAADGFDKIKALRENMTLDMDHVTMLFDIRDAICYENGTTKSNPRSKLPRNVPMQVVPSAPVRTLENVSTRDSDQWNQVLTVGAATAHNMASNLTEGIVITALKETLGDKYPQDFTDMTLDQQEAFLSSLNAVETTKVNINIMKKAQNLAEVLPPHFLVAMAKNVDKALSDKKIDNQIKGALSTQKDVLLKAMVYNVASYKNRELTVTSDNAAGVYDGATEMLTYLEDNLEAFPKNSRQGLKDGIDAVRNVLEDAIKIYDEDNGLKDVTKQDVKDIEKSYDELAKEAARILAQNKFEQTLDNDTLDIFKKLEFPATTDKDGRPVSAEENKKLFIEAVVHSAAQRTAVEHRGKKGQALLDAFKSQLQETTILETINLIMAEESVKMAQNPSLAASLTIKPEDKTEDKKNKLKAYISTLQDAPCKISKDAFVGYNAAKVCKHSLFLNRLATKIENRGAALLQKMWKPVDKQDQTCIKRFGNIYTAAKSLVKGNLQNLPWSISNAVVRTAAFSQVGMPWGLACVAGYGVYSLGTTAFRMIRQYKKMKKQDASMTAGKFFKNNWSGMALSLVGTAVSVIPGMAAASEIGWLKGTLNIMRDSGALDATTISGASSLGMTNASVGLVGAGVVDSTVRGAIAHHKNGDGWGKAFLKGAFYASASSTLGIATGIGCSYAANEFLPNQHMNMAGDTRTPEIKDGSFDPNNPDHYSETVGRGQVPLKFENPELANEFKTHIENLESGNLSEAEYKAEYGKLEKLLNEHGLSIEKNENGDIKIGWSEQEARYSNVKITTNKVERSVTEHAAFRAADWQRDVPGLHDSNIKAITGNTTINEFNQANPLMKVDPNRMEMIIMLCGGQAVEANVDTHVNHSQYSADVAVRGNHGVIADDWVKHYGNDKEIIQHCGNQAITKEEIAQIRGLHNSDGTFNSENLTPRLLQVINALDHKVSPTFEVGDLESTHGQEHTDKVLSRNGSNVDGVYKSNHDNPEFYITYLDGDSARNDSDRSGAETLEIKQWHERYYMPTNPSIDLYNIAAGEGMAKIMGQNGQRKSNDVSKPIDASRLPGIDNNNPSAPKPESASRGVPANEQKKGNIFTRAFRRFGGKNGK